MRRLVVYVGPMPSHWAQPYGPALIPRHLAYGFDALAAEAGGLEDGLALLLKTAGVSAGKLKGATRRQVGGWFYEAYEQFSPYRAPRSPDVVFHARGMWSLDSGWAGT